jgi:hypothetical protein
MRRPSVSADPTGMLSGVLGSRLLDRRPPHYRCPAVPGFNASARAILMALGSSVLPSGINHLPTERVLRTAGETNCNYSVACHSATLRQPAPSPVLRLLWLGTPLPNLPVRAPAADAFTEVPLTDLTAGYRELHLRELLTAAPDHCGPPGPVVSPVAVLQQPWLRNSTTAPPCELQLHYCCPPVRVCRALLSLWTTGETIARPPPHVYSRQHRFSRTGAEVWRRAAMEGAPGGAPRSRGPPATDFAT